MHARSTRLVGDAPSPSFTLKTFRLTIGYEPSPRWVVRGHCPHGWSEPTKLGPTALMRSEGRTR